MSREVDFEPEGRWRTSVTGRASTQALENRRVFEIWLRTACASLDQAGGNPCGSLRYIYIDSIYRYTYMRYT